MQHAVPVPSPQSLHTQSPRPQTHHLTPTLLELQQPTCTPPPQSGSSSTQVPRGVFARACADDLPLCAGGEVDARERARRADGGADQGARVLAGVRSVQRRRPRAPDRHRFALPLQPNLQREDNCLSFCSRTHPVYLLLRPSVTLPLLPTNRDEERSTN